MNDDINNDAFDDNHPTHINASLDNDTPLGYLLVRRPGHLFGQFFMIRGSALIGTGPGSTIQLDDRYAGNPHARIRLETPPNTDISQFGLYDFGTRGGTYVNGERITEHTVIKENDEIIIGEHVFAFKTLY